MPSLRDRLFEPADRHDVPLASRKGFHAGLFQAALHLVGFAALFVLGLVTGVVRSGGADTTTIGFWGAVVGAVVVGAGMVHLATVDRVSQFWRVPAGRLLTVLLLYAAFGALVVVDFTAALFAGPAFAVARVGAHAWLLLSG